MATSPFDYPDSIVEASDAPTSPPIQGGTVGKWIHQGEGHHVGAFDSSESVSEGAPDSELSRHSLPGGDVRSWATPEIISAEAEARARDTASQAESHTQRWRTWVVVGVLVLWALGTITALVVDLHRVPDTAASRFMERIMAVVLLALAWLWPTNSRSKD